MNAEPSVMVWHSAHVTTTFSPFAASPMTAFALMSLLVILGLLAVRRAPTRISPQLLGQYVLRRRVNRVDIHAEPELQGLQRRHPRVRHARRDPEGIGPKAFVTERLEAKDIAPEVTVPSRRGTGVP